MGGPGGCGGCRAAGGGTQAGAAVSSGGAGPDPAAGGYLARPPLGRARYPSAGLASPPGGSPGVRVVSG